MQNTINCLVNIECSSLAPKNKALLLHFVWLFLYGLRVIAMNLLSLHAIQEQVADSLQSWMKKDYREEDKQPQDKGMLH